MIQEDKELLLKDLCCRLRYGVKCYEDGVDYPFEIIGYTKTNLEFIYSDGYERPIEFIKPYLRPMSSMTEEERKELNRINNDGLDEWLNANNPIEKWTSTCRIDGESVDYMNSRHLDYRGLIPKGLALEAPKDMYT